MHPNEPSIEELKRLYKELMTAESTDDNLKKLKALTTQLERRSVEVKNVKTA